MITKNDNNCVDKNGYDYKNKYDGKNSFGHYLCNDDNDKNNNNDDIKKVMMIMLIQANGGLKRP